LEDFAWLTRLGGSLSSELLYTVHDRSASFVKPDALPWHVFLTFGIRSRKFRFRSKRRINEKCINQAVRDFRSRLYWWHYFASKPNDDRDAVAYRPLIQRAPKRFEGAPNVIIRSFADSIFSAVKSHLKSTNSVISSHPQEASNTPSFVAFALRWLRARNLKVCLSDKDGVFCVVHSAELSSMVKEKLKGPSYQQISSAQLGVEERQMRAHGMKICWMMQKAGYVKESHDCRACLLEGRPTYLLSVNVKTHKPQGQVAVRMIHSSAGHSAKALSVFIDRLLQPLVREIPHLAADSGEVLEVVKQTSFGPLVCFAKVDIKDFYMSGDHSFLIQAIKHQALPEQRAVLEEVLTWLLYYQFIQNKEYIDNGENSAEPELFQVIGGSGMGAPHSGSVSDLAFHWVAEKGLIQGTSCRQFGVDVFVRFRDDILMIGSAPKLMKSLINRLRMKSSPHYVLEVETTSTVGVPMLDIFVYKPQQYHGRLEWSPYIKPSSRHIPLNSTSNHQSGIHKSWPLQEISRMHKLSCRDHQFEQFRGIKIARFQLHLLDRSVIQACKSWRSRCCVSGVRGNDGLRVLRIIVPYHPYLQRAFQRKIDGVIDKWKDIISQKFTVRVTYSGGGKQLGAVARQLKI